MGVSLSEEWRDQQNESKLMEAIIDGLSRMALIFFCIKTRKLLKLYSNPYCTEIVALKYLEYKTLN